MTLDNLVVIGEKFSEIVPKLNQATIQHADEINRYCRDHPEVANLSFVTGNGVVYAVKNGEPVLYLTPRGLNPILNNFPEAVKQLERQGYYDVPTTDLAALTAAAETGAVLSVQLSGLKLQAVNDVRSRLVYFDIQRDQPKFNQAQRALVERLYGQGDEFIHHRNALIDMGYEQSAIAVVNPDWVKHHITEGRAIAVLGELGGYNLGSNFTAEIRYTRDGLIFMIGALNSIKNAYKTLLAHPVEAADALAPEITGPLPRIVDRHLKTQRSSQSPAGNVIRLPHKRPCQQP